MPPKTPFPLVVTLPAPGAYTDSFRVFLLILEETIDRVLEQPSTVIRFDCLKKAPFCPVISVGISRFVSHRFLTAPRSEFSFSGRFSSNEDTGSSGTVSNLL